MNYNLMIILFSLGPLELLIILVGLPLYFLPSIVGLRKLNGVYIMFLNLFLGWTVLGWIGALIWAATSPKEALYTYICSKCGYKHSLDQQVKIHVCPQCKHESLYE
jgi:DNA-directed RNA polymerase subunit RPC12/RpoP